HSLNDWLLEKVGEPESGFGVVFRLLQLCENPFINPLHSGYGGGYNQECLEPKRPSYSLNANGRSSSPSHFYSSDSYNRSCRVPACVQAVQDKSSKVEI